MRTDEQPAPHSRQHPLAPQARAAPPMPGPARLCTCPQLPLLPWPSIAPLAGQGRHCQDLHPGARAPSWASGRTALAGSGEPSQLPPLSPPMQPAKLPCCPSNLLLPVPCTGLQPARRRVLCAAGHRPPRRVPAPMLLRVVSGRGSRLVLTRGGARCNERQRAAGCAADSAGRGQPVTPARSPGPALHRMACHLPLPH